MSVNTFENFHLLIHLVCVDCHHEQTLFIYFFCGEIFNREGDIVLSDVGLINFSHQTCNGCKNFMFIDFIKFIRLLSYEKFMMDCVLSKEKIKIKNMLPKNHEISSPSGETR